MTDLWNQSFAYPLSSLAEVSDDPLELDPETTAEFRAALDDIAKCRAQAAVSAQNYVVWR